MEDVVAVAVTLLNRQDGVVTSEALDEVVQRVAPMAPDVDLEVVRRQLEEQVIVHADRAVSLVQDHRPWLAAKRASIEWWFWTRYRHWLETTKGLPPEVISRLDDATDQILDLTADPATSGPWDRRGLVVGHVQSGKTGNYLGLIAKAIDAGYRVIVVLAGAHNDLRSQTQLRLDEGILGWDTHVERRPPGSDGDESDHRVGVGRLASFGLLDVRSLTSSAQNGDFSKTQAKVVERLTSVPLVLVIKKNKSVLENVDRWLRTLNAVPAEDGRQVIPGHSLLLIDDEADHYSINTARDDPSADEIDPTTINRLIRQILQRFEKSAYVGYTATAFANIFIDDTEEHSEHGQDLFPRSFIISLRAPSNYLGPARVFGLRAPDDDQDDVNALPIIRNADDHQDWLPTPHKNGHRPARQVPDSLKYAIRSFILTCAARRARGQVNVHNSMLVHVTRFNSVQQEVSDAVREELDNVRRRLLLGSGTGQDVLEELRGLWESDFVPTSEAVNEELGVDGDADSWEAVRGELKEAVGRIEIRTVNGTARDALEYFEHNDTGISVIAIGGDKLSRGLTLEGLSVSYYLRASKAYDTLLQMGRWFGYRPGYADLCRLYTTRQLSNWYADITLANAELLADFDQMVAANATPTDFGLRVRTHPDGLLVSNPNKIRNADRIRLSFSRHLSETVTFDREPEVRRANVGAVRQLLEDIEERDGLKGTRAALRSTVVFDGVSGNLISDFFDRAKTSNEAVRARTDLLSQYIDRRLRCGELTDWTVALVSSSTSDRQTVIAERHEIGLLTRTGNWEHGPEREKAPVSNHTVYRIKRLVNPADEFLGLDEQQVDRASQSAADRAKRRGRPAPGKPSGYDLRGVRDPAHGLLLLYPLDPIQEHLPPRDDEPSRPPLPYLGIAVSFPESPDPKAAVEYLGNTVFQRLESL